MEDVVLIAAMLEQALAEAGYLVTTAENGTSALAAAIQARAAGAAFDVAVVDLGLPDMSGGDVIRQLRADAPRLPVVVVTGYINGQGTDGCQGQLGSHDPFAFAILPKPIDLANLCATVQRVQAEALTSAA